MFKRNIAWLCAIVLILGSFVLAGCGETDFNGTYTGSKTSGSNKVNVTVEVKKGNLKVSLKTYDLDENGEVDDTSDPVTYQYEDKYKKDKSGDSISIPEDANGESAQLLSEDGEYYLVIKEGKKNSIKIALKKGDKKEDKDDKKKTEKVEKEVRMATVLAEPADSSWNGHYTGKGTGDYNYKKIDVTIDNGEALVVEDYGSYEGQCLSIKKDKEIRIVIEGEDSEDYEMKKFAGKMYISDLGDNDIKYEVVKK